MSSGERVVYETPDAHIVRLVLNRPDVRNAQDTELLYKLNDAFDRAAQDNTVKVIILAARGPHFSSGHDLNEADAQAAMKHYPTVGTWAGFEAEGAEGRMARENEIYLGFSERWRNIPKPTIAQVHGKCISGGLMLAWPCDLIIASDDALFADNTVALGVAGAEYFAHPWEVGVRKAKEMLFTANWITAAEAKQLGMVNQVVASDELGDYTLSLARRIAEKSLFALRMAKEAVNAAQDVQGRATALRAAFWAHHLTHSHNMERYGGVVDPMSPAFKKFAPPKE